MPLISVIVPVYNVQKYIETCVESIVQQTYHNLEIILIDDGSVDGSGEKCDMLAQRDSRIKVVHICNSGVSNARNLGIEMATGDYIAFVDGDDWIDVNMYEKMVNKIKNSSNTLVDAVFTLFTYAHANGECEPYKEDLECLRRLRENPGDIKSLLSWNAKTKWLGNPIYRMGAGIWRTLYRKEILLSKSLRFDLNLKMNEDRIFMMEFLCNVKNLEVVEEYLYYYRLGRSGSACTTQINSLLMNYKHEKNLYLKKLDIIASNNYFDEQAKNFFLVLADIEYYFVVTRAILTKSENYKELLCEFHKDETTKKIIKKLSLKNLRKVGDIRVVVLLKLIRHKFWWLSRMLLK